MNQRATHNFKFSVDPANEYLVSMEETPWAQKAISKDMVLANAVAMAQGMFGHVYFCGVNEVMIVEQSFDENAMTCSVSIEGPVGEMYHRQFEIPEPLLGALQVCETNCVASCCDWDAFQFDAEQLREWAGSFERTDALEVSRKQIGYLVDQIQQLEGVYFNRQTGIYCDANSWKENLGKVKTALLEAEKLNGEPKILSVHVSEDGEKQS